MNCTLFAIPGVNRLLTIRNRNNGNIFRFLDLDMLKKDKFDMSLNFSVLNGLSVP